MGPPSWTARIVSTWVASAKCEFANICHQRTNTSSGVNAVRRRPIAPASILARARGIGVERNGSGPVELRIAEGADRGRGGRAVAQVAAVASAVGYESEAAVSRAFKKLVGQSAGASRTGQRPEPTASAGCGAP